MSCLNMKISVFTKTYSRNTENYAYIYQICMCIHLNCLFVVELHTTAKNFAHGYVVFMSVCLLIIMLRPRHETGHKLDIACVTILGSISKNSQIFQYKKSDRVSVFTNLAF